jgi:hypothetical protein
MSERVFNQEEPVIRSAGIEDATKNRSDHQRDQTLPQPHDGKAHDPYREPYLVRHDVTQQPAEFFSLRQ